MRQALVLGDLENICDALIIADSNRHERAMAFGEFEKYLLDSAHDESLQEVLSLFTGFSPTNRPVLARILVAQAVMAELILYTYGHEIAVEGLQSRLESIVSSREMNEELAWQGEVCGDLPIALEYWKERLEWLRARDS